MTCSSTTELQKMWSIFSVGQNNPISLRAITPKGTSIRMAPRNLTFNARNYPEIQDRKLAFQEAALRLNAQGYNVYIPLNPIAADFAGDEHNKLAVSDEHISCRQRLLIDLDRAGSTKAPATVADIAEAQSVADIISDYLAAEHDAVPIRVMSGNGVHLYLPFDDIPNDAHSSTFCKKLLLRLAARFNTETIKVDTSVYNASRITKVPGTIARKGVETVERPYRMAIVL